MPQHQCGLRSTMSAFWGNRTFHGRAILAAIRRASCFVSCLAAESLAALFRREASNRSG